MNIGDFLHSKRWKLMQNYIYSWGASVVLIGALFKLEHLPGASVFLGVGLSIEAIIFFVSAFEPMMETPDWKVVYPQLRTGDESARERERYQKGDEIMGNRLPSSTQPAAILRGESSNATFGSIPEAQLNKLKESFDQLSQTANGLKRMADAVTVTDGFVKNLNEASAAVGSVASANKKVSVAMEEGASELSSAFKTSAQQMKESSAKAALGVDKTVSDLSGIYTSTANDLKTSSQQVASSMQKTAADLSTSMVKTSGEFNEATTKTAKSLAETGTEFGKKVNQSAEELTTSYKSMTSSLSNGFKGLEKGADKYVANLDKLNKNLAAINTAYELHLKGTDKVEEIVKDYSKGVGEIGKLLNTSIEETKKFNQHTKDINDNIQALNNIYGKMLGALNGKR